MRKVKIDNHPIDNKGLKKNDGFWRFGIFVADLIVLFLSGVVALLLRNRELASSIPTLLIQVKQMVVPSVLLYLGAFYFLDLYNPQFYESKIEILSGIIKASVLAILLLSAYEFLFQKTVFSRSYVLMQVSILIPLLYAVRSAWLTHVKRANVAVERVLFIGTPEDIEAALASVRQNGLKRDCSIIGAVLSHNGVDEVGGVKVLGKIKDISDIVKDYAINRIIIVSPINYRKFVEEIHEKIDRDIRIEIVPGIYEILIGKPDYALIADIPLIKIVREDPPEWYSLAKRIMDIAIALTLIVTTFPIWILAGIAIKLTSPGPIFYKQKRVGQNGRVFTIWKFRTMVNDAEKDSGPRFASKEDNRITPVGKILRKYRIDELPQLLNVIKGEMSMVGPRPERVEFVRQFEKEIPFYHERHKVKPGITGLAQVWGNYSTSPGIKLKYDLIYIYNRSILLDLEILLKTAKVVLQGTGV